jgi:hypothetical protein
MWVFFIFNWKVVPRLLTVFNFLVMEGFQNRIKNEFNFNFYYKKERFYSVYLGGDIISSLSSFNDKWLFSNNYNEFF